MDNQGYSDYFDAMMLNEKLGRVNTDRTLWHAYGSEDIVVIPNVKHEIPEPLDSVLSPLTELVGGSVCKFMVITVNNVWLGVLVSGFDNRAAERKVFCLTWGELDTD